jgi:hypothetical protein
VDQNRTNVIIHLNGWGVPSGRARIRVDKRTDWRTYCKDRGDSLRTRFLRYSLFCKEVEKEVGQLRQETNGDWRDRESVGNSRRELNRQRKGRIDNMKLHKS